MSYYKPPECDGVPTPSRNVIEPDWIASECDDQLPAFSKIGRGPRGKGVYAEIEKTDDGQVIIHFKDDETGEEIGNTGDIAAGRISVSYAPKNPVAGDEVKMFVSVRSGSSVANYVVPVPSGAYGSRIYLLPGPVVRNRDDTYQCSVDDLTIYGLQRWESKPEPRPNDVILFNYEGSDGHGFAFGTVEAVERGQVVYTARVFNTLPGVSILPDGTWAVDGESTGIKAQGPKGEDAKIKIRREGGKAVITATDSDGETEAEVLDGKDGQDAKLTVQRAENGAVLTATDADGATTAAVRDGSDGEDGSDGLPAKLTLGSVQETSQVSVTLVPGHVQENEYIISFGLPRGADGKSIDINGGVYRVDQLPDFDETPVNDAFVVLDSDDRFDLYIRGKEAVIAEEGGPWTVVEDWQGVNGYSMRMLAGRKISTEEVLRIPVGEVETVFVPHNGLRDGDLVFDDNGTIGIVGSAMDGSGDYTVSYIDKMNVHWDNIDGKPVLASTHSIELAEADGQVTADLRLSGEHSNAKFSTVDGKVTAHLDHNVAPAGLGDHSLYFSSDGFKNDSGTIALSDAVTESLGKANSAVQEDDLTAAIAAEASAREKADQLLETEIESKLDTADLVAGKNISITHDPESGKVTIDNTMKLVDSASGPVVHIDNNAYAKPLGLKVFGQTRQNLWKNPSGTNNGVTVTSNEDGSITLSGTATQRALFALSSYMLRPGNTYTVESDKKMSDSWVAGEAESGAGFAIVYRNAENTNQGQVLFGYDSNLVKTFTVPSATTYVSFYVIVEEGVAVSGTYRIMLNKGGEAQPWCPPGLNSVESLGIVAAGKNLGTFAELIENDGSLSDRGITSELVEGGGIRVHGTATGGTAMVSFGIVALPPGLEVTLSMGSQDSGVALRWTDIIYGFEFTTGSPKTFISKDTGKGAFVIAVNDGTTVDTIVYPQLELGSTATEYEPPNVTSTPIDLDGNQLCSLPDGTRDELHVDESGAVTLVKRCNPITLPSEASSWVDTGEDDAKRYRYALSPLAKSGYVPEAIRCDVLPPRARSTAEAQTGTNICATGNSVYVTIGSGETAESVANVVEGGTLLYKLATPQEIPLDAVALPALPAPNANVWAAAEVPADIEMEYLTEDAEVLTRFLMPSNIKAGSNVSIDVDGNDVTVSSSGGGTGSVDTATDEEFQEYMGY